MASLKESLAGPGYVILNTIRVLNIIVLMDMIAACVVMLVKIKLQTSFFFFEAVSHVATAGACIFLIVSELPILNKYFDRHWPALGQDAGFLTLSLAMLIMGVGLLGDLNYTVNDSSSIGLVFWRIIISAGILALVMSVINIVATFVFCDRNAGVTARHVRLYGAVAPQKVLTRTNSNRSFQLSMKRENSLPTYNTQPPAKRFSRFPLKISSPINPAHDAASSKYSRDSQIYPLTSELHSIKSLLIFFAPVLIPKAINFYRGLRVSLASRPSPQPLPATASRALNVLFFSVVLFLLLSLPFNPHGPTQNIFALTRSRLNTPTDVIFARLARYRPQNTLTSADIVLQSKFISRTARNIYLRFGQDALITCQFCSLDSPDTYLLYYLPFNTLLPHLFHMIIVGLVTSAPFAGRAAAQWRNKFTIAGLALAAADLYIMATYDPVQSASAAVRAGQSPPSSLYTQISLLRPLALTIFDSVCAFLIYVSATNRFFFPPVSQADQIDKMVSMAAATLTETSAKLHGLSVTRNAVVRDKTLKTRDDNYWRAVVCMENETVGTANSGGPSSTAVTSVWEEEEVVRAMSRAMAGQGGVDLARLGVSANEYVNGITAGLEKTDDTSP
ncbi:hypothetical protein ASPZODRAFT_153673 [Penicilliopsis zonata CBS 506.65]|uniref:DUF7598 domain-containing protein n=1 Tax=Penicilliopsis zonata CBS 506.65 TaxID=1073090 RepID=A0A1L9SCF3_9EURO|nr:hypothetical protein ASPZODRAFT_153673 [Penicilliopsis zonata CBS 506.65]OJJ44798.1 hypothetical protein ASPZODRAFT_153673 [Penicilliopsis zonata CBS 506.65]